MTTTKTTGLAGRLAVLRCNLWSGYIPPDACNVIAEAEGAFAPTTDADLEQSTAQITATRIHDVYQEEFYRKDKTGALVHPTHADLIKAVIHRLLGVEITEPWDSEKAEQRVRAIPSARGALRRTNETL